MNLSYAESLAWLMENQETVDHISVISTHELVICPSFVALVDSARLLQKAKSVIKLGAQDCSAHDKGAYTGQTSARSLSEVGVGYCIVGHSERRSYETAQEIAQKVEELIRYSIKPIICIGEQQQGQTKKQLERSLYNQLITLLPVINTTRARGIFIAYEPAWAIGTGLVPPLADLEEIFAWLKTIVGATVPLLYGGSVNEHTSYALSTVPFVEGFLIGGASINMQTLKKIVLSTV